VEYRSASLFRSAQKMKEGDFCFIQHFADPFSLRPRPAPSPNRIHLAIPLTPELSTYEKHILAAYTLRESAVVPCIHIPREGDRRGSLYYTGSPRSVGGLVISLHALKEWIRKPTIHGDFLDCGDEE